VGFAGWCVFYKRLTPLGSFCYKYATPKESFVLPGVFICTPIKSIIHHAAQLPNAKECTYKAAKLNEVKKADVK